MTVLTLYAAALYNNTGVPARVVSHAKGEAI